MGFKFETLDVWPYGGSNATMAKVSEAARVLRSHFNSKARGAA